MFKNMAGKTEVIIVSVIGVLLLSVVAWVVLTSNQVVKVWVPKAKITAGDTVTADLIKQIEIPKKTPGEYIKNKNQIVGFKLKNSVDANQLFYPSDFLASWESYSQDINVPDDYVVTSIQVPDNQACGGLIVAGDTIDVLGVSTTGKKIGFDEAPSSGINGRDNIGTNVYYILSNVKVLNTNSTLSQAQENDMSEVVNASDNSKTNDGSYYIIALSYDDLKKLRQAEGLLSIWLNISPKQNISKEPLIQQMIGQSASGLHDAQKQVQNPDGTLKSEVSSVNDGGTTNTQTPKQQTQPTKTNKTNGAN